MTEEFTKIGFLKWKVGSHSKFCKNIFNTIENSLNYGMEVTQFFFGNPKSFKRHSITDKDILKTRKLLDKYPMHVFSHFPYISNLAGSVKQLSWEGCMEQDTKTLLVIKSLQYELDVMSKFGITNGVIIHPGNYKDRKKGLETISKSINKIHFAEGSSLLLENAAGQGCALATTFKEIKYIIEGVEDVKYKHIGVCVDTAHIYGYGEYNLSRCSEVERMFNEFDKVIGMEKFKLLHLNDSVVSFGSKKDRHALIGTGYIWRENIESLILLLDKCTEFNIPIVLETNVLDMLTIGSISSYIKNEK